MTIQHIRMFQVLWHRQPYATRAMFVYQEPTTHSHMMELRAMNVSQVTIALLDHTRAPSVLEAHTVVPLACRM